MVADEIQRLQSDVLPTLCIGLGTASHVIDDIMHALDTNEYTYLVPPQTSEKMTARRLLRVETLQNCLYPAPRGFQGHDVSSLGMRENELQVYTVVALNLRQKIIFFELHIIRKFITKVSVHDT